jgi:hypothetical protein
MRAAFFLAMALTLGTGQSAALLCQAFCDRPTSAEDADACKHNQSTAQTSMTNGTDCTSLDLTTALNRAELNKTTVAAPLAAIATVLPPEAFPDSGLAGSIRLTAGSQPRMSILRI